jgi:hypothetical protein
MPAISGWSGWPHEFVADTLKLSLANRQHRPATPAFAMQTHPVGRGFPDGVSVDHWTNDKMAQAQPR